MQIKNPLLLLALVFALPLLSSHDALADCSAAGALPQFTDRLDPTTVPKPSEPFTLTGLELYRTNLEIFRENSVEGYNKKLIRYSERLKRFDNRFRNLISAGKCSADDYEAIKPRIEEELTKVGNEYLDPYNDCMTAYKNYITFYQAETGRLRLAAYQVHMQYA